MAKTQHEKFQLHTLEQKHSSDSNGKHWCLYLPLYWPYSLLQTSWLSCTIFCLEWLIWEELTPVCVCVGGLQRGQGATWLPSPLMQMTQEVREVSTTGGGCHSTAELWLVHPSSQHPFPHLWLVTQELCTHGQSMQQFFLQCSKRCQSEATSLYHKLLQPLSSPLRMWLCPTPRLGPSCLDSQSGAAFNAFVYFWLSLQWSHIEQSPAVAPTTCQRSLCKNSHFETSKEKSLFSLKSKKNYSRVLFWYLFILIVFKPTQIVLLACQPPVAQS